MYGTIMKVRVAPENAEKMQELYEELYPTGELPAGAVAVFDFQMDDDPTEFFHIAIFESRDAYRANAESPEQHARFEKAVAFIKPVGEPQWNDGQVVNAVIADPAQLLEKAGVSPAQ